MRQGFGFGKQLLAIVKRDVSPALGCTEPISLALASVIAFGFATATGAIAGDFTVGLEVLKYIQLH